MKFNGLVCGLLMAAGSLAHGQETAVVTPTEGTEVRRVSQILGSTVQLQGVNNFGKVEDIVLSDNGGIGYLVVSANGKYAMLPWNAGNVNYAQRVVTYDVTPQAIQPFYFQRNAYPNISAQQFTSQMQQVFPNAGGVRAATRTVQPGNPVVEEQQKAKVRPNGTVITKDRETVRPTQPGQPVIEETQKVKERPNGTVIIKDKQKVRDR
ncbi:MAG: PRC-barrel domain-containing protein [Actinobacteria bacterium]|nr:PRC-barrel domain-containing protein [Actinomycetota bacterium]